MPRQQFVTHRCSECGTYPIHHAINSPAYERTKDGAIVLTDQPAHTFKFNPHGKAA